MRVTREGEVFLPHDPCGDRVETIFAMIHGDLSTPEEKALLAHVEHCPGCASFLELHELIDDEFQSYFSAQKIATPIKIPKSVGIQLSLTRKKNLAMWLHELGRAIFFQQPEAVDTFHPGKPPYHPEQCLRAIENVSASALEDPFLREVGISTELVTDCRVFLHDLGMSQERLLYIGNTKEVLDRSLAIEPESVSVLKSLGAYLRFTKDYTLAAHVLGEALRFTRSSEDKRSVSARLALLSQLSGDFSTSFQYLETARKIRYDFSIDFIDFMNYVDLREVDCARESISLMDNKIKTGMLSDDDQISLSLISKWFIRRSDAIAALVSNDSHILGIMFKYMGAESKG